MTEMVTRIRVAIARLAALLRRGAGDAAFDEEVRAHLDLLAADHEADGLSPSEARLAARRDFGSDTRIRMLYRDQQRVPFIESLLQDARLACRVFVRDRAFAVTTVLVLGLGVGVTHMFLTIVYAHTWRGLPAREVTRLLYVSVLDERGVDRPLNRDEYEALGASARSLGSVAAFTSAPATVGDEGHAPDRVEAGYIAPGALALVGARPLRGRDFEAADHEPGAPPAALLGETLWRVRYGRDSAAVGRAILVNGSPATVVGIVSDASGFPSTAGIWMPLQHAPGLVAQPSDQRSLRVLARPSEGATVSDAEREIAAILEQVGTGRAAVGPGVRARVLPVNERLLGRIEGPWLAFLLAGCVIVLIACANTANLLLARAFHRAREVAVRVSLGASRARLIRQLLTESLVIALVGGAVGLAVSIAGVRLFGAAIPAGTLPYWLAYTLDLRLLAVLLALSTASAVAFGLVPAFLGSRTNVQAVLRDGGRAQSASRAGRPWMVGFLSVEIALSVVLLVAIAIGGLSLRSRVPSDAVANTTEVVTAVLTLPAAKYSTPDARARVLGALVDRVASTPGVTAVSITAALPLGGVTERTAVLEGRDVDRDDAPSAGTVAVGPAYFRTLGLHIIQGREFTADDGRPGSAVALVNERFVTRFGSTAPIVGARIAIQAPAGAPRSGETGWRTIVGVVPDLRQRSRPADAEPIVYLPALEAPPATTTLVVRSTEATDTVASALRSAALSVDTSVPLYRIQTMAQAIRDADWNPRLSAQLANLLTMLCLLLATVGLYAVTAHGVSLRRQELGIRMALGATPGCIARLVLAGARTPVGLGLLLGLAGAVAWQSAFPPTQPDLTVTNPLVLGTVMCVLVLVTLVACLAPVRRATRLDPARVLRDE